MWLYSKRVRFQREIGLKSRVVDQIGNGGGLSEQISVDHAYIYSHLQADSGGRVSEFVPLYHGQTNHHAWFTMFVSEWRERGGTGKASTLPTEKMAHSNRLRCYSLYHATFRNERAQVTQTIIGATLK